MGNFVCNFGYFYFATNTVPKSILRKLINYRTINANDNLGNVPLHYTCEVKFELDNLELLLSNKNIELNIKNKNGSTALHTAVLFRRKKLISKLIEVGADVNIKNNLGETPLDVAIKFKDNEIIDLIKEDLKMFRQ